MSPKTVLACAACLVAGVGIGMSSLPRTTQAPPDLSAPTRVTEVFDIDYSAPKNPETVQIIPFRVEEDGKVRDIPDAPRHGRTWVLMLDGGRIKIFGTSEVK